MRIVRLDHVQLPMPPGGEERARSFFGEALGIFGGAEASGVGEARRMLVRAR